MIGGMRVVRPYFKLGLRMTSLKRDCIKCRLSRGEGEGLGEGGKGVGPNRPTNGEGGWNGVSGVGDAGRLEGG